TMAEAGLPDFDAGVWFGLVAPAGTSRAVIEKLSAAANAALASEEVAGKLRAQGFEPLGGPPDEFARYIARETVKGAVPPEAAGLKKQYSAPTERYLCTARGAPVRPYGRYCAGPRS